MITIPISKQKIENRRKQAENDAATMESKNYKKERRSPDDTEWKPKDSFCIHADNDLQ